MKGERVTEHQHYEDRTEYSLCGAERPKPLGDMERQEKRPPRDRQIKRPVRDRKESDD